MPPNPFRVLKQSRHWHNAPDVYYLIPQLKYISIKNVPVQVVAQLAAASYTPSPHVHRRSDGSSWRGSALVLCTAVCCLRYFVACFLLDSWKQVDHQRVYMYTCMHQVHFIVPVAIKTEVTPCDFFITKRKNNMKQIQSHKLKRTKRRKWVTKVPKWEGCR